MTEAEWRASNSPYRMLTSLQEVANERKFRLFACAACRRVWHHINDEEARSAVEASEGFADGNVSEVELAHIHRKAFANYERSCNSLTPHDTTHWTELVYPVFAVGAAADCASLIPPDKSWEDAATLNDGYWNSHQLAYFASRDPDWWAKEAAALRDLFGNPFRSAPQIDSEWIAWNNGAVHRLAEEIYCTRRFDQLTELAEILTEAGCRDRELLDHLRSAGPHERGCWALDLLLDLH